MKGFWERRAAGFVVVAITLALYSPTLTFRRVQLDDYWLWADDSPLRHPDGSTLRAIAFDFDAHSRHPLGTEYLPVRDVVVALDMQIWGDNERGPHVTQLLLYALTVLGLGTLLIRFSVSRQVAWLAALLWGLHPVHVESVAWLSERKGVLAGLMVIACGHAWIRYRENRSTWWLVAAALASVAGVWSKAPAMFGFPLLAVLDLLLLPRDARRWRAITAVGIATALAAIPVVLVASRARVIGEQASHAPGRLASAIGAQGHYLESLVLARPTSIAYAIQTDGPSTVTFALGIVAVAASLAAAWWLRRTDPSIRNRGLALLAVGWILFLPVSHLLVPVHILVADRFVYLWSVAACIGAAALLQRVPGAARTAAIAFLVGVLGISTIRAEGAWVSSTELFQRAVRSNPRDPVAAENLAIALQREGQPLDAVSALDRCLSFVRDEPHLLSRKATILFDLGRSEEALGVSLHAAETGAASAMWTHAVLLRRAGKLADARPWADRAALKHPELVDYVRTRAAILVDLQRYDEALPALQATVALDPDAALDHLILARVLIKLGRPDEARLHLDAAARDPALATSVAAVREMAARQ